tara:strand:+ start:31933 stop:32448 length:516 start_codon:yes stop_codon:yes gene_type:complete
MADNIMRSIKLEKINLNLGVGSPGDKLENAVKLLKTITGEKPVKTVGKKRIPTWGVRPNLEIACRVTVRGKKAEEVLKRLFTSVKNTIAASKFDDQGNFAFGIPEYLSIPGMEYDTKIGIIGLEVAVTLQRPGFRIKRRKLKKTKVPQKHNITKEEAIEFVKQKFSATIAA